MYFREHYSNTRTKCHNMAENRNVSTIKVKTMENMEFDISDDLLNDMQTLQNMKAFSDNCCEKQNENIPICAVEGNILKFIIAWTESQNFLKNFDLIQIFKTVLTADYLQNEKISKELLRLVFENNSKEEIEEACNQFNNQTIFQLIADYRKKNEILVTLNRDSIIFYEFDSQDWKIMTNIPEHFSYMKVACANKHNVYIIGSNEENGMWRHVGEYNIINKTWRMLANATLTPIIKMYWNTTYIHNAFIIKNKLYIWSTSYINQGSLKVLDLSIPNPKWEDIANHILAPFWYDCPAIAVDGEEIYIVRADKYPSISKYDTNQKKWQILTALQTIRKNPALAIIKKTIYISGGYVSNYEEFPQTPSSKKESNEVITYNITKNKFSYVKSMNNARAHHKLLNMGDTLIAVGGKGSPNTIEEFDIAKNTWTTKPIILDNYSSRGTFMMMKNNKTNF